LALFDFFASSEQKRQVLNVILLEPQGGVSGSMAQVARNYRGGMARLEADFGDWTSKLAR